MQKEGRLAIFKGLKVSFYRNLLHQWITANLYKVCKSDMIKNSSNDEYNSEFNFEVAFVSSSLARIISTFLTYPFEVLKTKAMSEVAYDTQPKYNRLITSLRYISHSEGLVGLYRGGSTKLYLVVTQALTTTLAYHFILAKNEQHNQLAGFAMLSGINFLIHYPLDTIMKNIQLQGFMGNKDSILGAYRIAKETVKPGFGNLYSGSLYYLVNTAFIMGCQRMIFGMTNK